MNLCILHRSTELLNPLFFTFPDPAYSTDNHGNSLVFPLLSCVLLLTVSVYFSRLWFLLPGSDRSAFVKMTLSSTWIQTKSKCADCFSSESCGWPLVCCDWLDPILVCCDWLDTIMVCCDWLNPILYCDWLDTILVCCDWLDTIMVCCDWLNPILYCDWLDTILVCCDWLDTIKGLTWFCIFLL